VSRPSSVSRGGEIDPPASRLTEPWATVFSKRGATNDSSKQFKIEPPSRLPEPWATKLSKRGAMDDSSKQFEN
jgi:hypothetical protein